MYIYQFIVGVLLIALGTFNIWESGKARPQPRGYSFLPNGKYRETYNTDGSIIIKDSYGKTVAEGKINPVIPTR